MPDKVWDYVVFLEGGGHLCRARRVEQAGGQGVGEEVAVQLPAEAAQQPAKAAEGEQAPRTDAVQLLFEVLEMCHYHSARCCC